jgi:recombination protein RecT
MNAVLAEQTDTVDQPKKQLRPYQDAISKAKDRFAKVAGDGLDYDKESIFAAQALMKTDYAMQVANKNPSSVHLAMINVASTGLTLNPANAYAYLVPRDGAIVLDISYKGLIKIATDCGAVLWARADVVHENDGFTYRGPAAMPDHTADAFRDRGEIIGCYAIAKTVDGDILTEIMDRAEIEKIRGKSDLYAKRKSGPWVEWFQQMVKKAVIKRASKTWPYTDRMSRLMEAIELANEGEGGYTLDAPAVELVSEAQIATIKEWIESTESDEAKFCKAMGVETVEALPAAKYAAAITLFQEKSDKLAAQK